MLIGFIGQGFVGKSYADDFEHRGFNIVRYALHPPHSENKNRIKNCDVVFIAVPTPTTPKGFDYSIVKDAVGLVGNGKVAVIKSTILPGTTEAIQKTRTKIFVMHSPEFLTEATASYDAAHPNRNIIGIPKQTAKYKEKAQCVLDVLPRAPFELICGAKEAELSKYGGNCWFYFKVIYVNLLYGLAKKLDIKYEVVRSALAADPRIGYSHLDPMHKGGRGAGGHCFIKDFAAFAQIYKKVVKEDKLGKKLLEDIAAKNISLLKSSGKDLQILADVYGKQKIKSVNRVDKS